MSGLGNVYFQGPRCMLTWRYGAVSGTDSTTGVVTATTPPDSARVASMLGGQAKIDVLCNWATGNRAGGGLQRIVLKPRYQLFYATGAGLPNANVTSAADRDQSVVVRFADSDRRVPLGGIVRPVTVGTFQPSVPHKYRPREITPTVPVQERVVVTELVEDRLEFYRAADPGTAYGQGLEFWYDLMGVGGQTLGISGSTDPYRQQIPLERAFYFEVGWITEAQAEGPDDDLDSPFLDGDEISILIHLGKAANG